MEKASILIILHAIVDVMIPNDSSSALLDEKGKIMSEGRPLCYSSLSAHTTHLEIDNPETQSSWCVDQLHKGQTTFNASVSPLAIDCRIDSSYRGRKDLVLG